MLSGKPVYNSMEREQRGNSKTTRELPLLRKKKMHGTNPCLKGDSKNRNFKALNKCKVLFFLPAV